ncbi:tRNA (adenosine(37)-N6)-threonylcarbamoyltransferase complex ATPase subunit type 1 TsaE [Candidatus Nitrospira bockiana]
MPSAKRSERSAARVPPPHAHPTGQGWSVRSTSPNQTARLGQAIGQRLEGGEVFALCGDLGSGKTVFVRGLAAGLGVAERAVSSPTFVLVHEYRGRLRLAHADLYRLDAPPALAGLGLDEYFDGNTVVAVEWADRAEDRLPSDRLTLSFEHIGPKTRRIRIGATGAHSQKVLERLFPRPRTERRPDHRRTATSGGGSR